MNTRPTSSKIQLNSINNLAENSADSMPKKSIRTFYLCINPPFPPVGGTALRNWQNISILKKLGPVAVFSISGSYDKVHKDSFSHPPGVALWKHNYLAPLTRLQQFWQSLEWRLLPQSHYFVNWPYERATQEKLEITLNEFNPDLIVISELSLARYFPCVVRQSCPVILDEHNIEAPLLAEKRAIEKGLKAKAAILFDVSKLKNIEKTVIQQSDQVWVCSQSDVELVQKLYKPSVAIKIVPNGIDIDRYASIYSRQFDHTPTIAPAPHAILYPATFNYKPNQVAARLLIDQIFPLLQIKFPDSQLILAGKSPTDFMIEAAKRNSGIIVTGLVPDMLPYLSAASVVVVPLQQGGGTRLKILEAFAAGRPVVSTTKGAEGIKSQDGVHLLIRDQADDFVEGICQLWRDPSLQNTLTQNAYQLVKDEYSWETIGQRVLQYVNQLSRKG